MTMQYSDYAIMMIIEDENLNIKLHWHALWCKTCTALFGHIIIHMLKLFKFGHNFIHAQ